MRPVFNAFKLYGSVCPGHDPKFNQSKFDLHLNSMSVRHSPGHDPITISLIKVSLICVVIIQDFKFIVGGGSYFTIRKGRGSHFRKQTGEGQFYITDLS